jgi:hypothetical protein
LRQQSALDVAAGPYDRRRQVTKAVPGARLIHRRRLVNDEGRELTPSELAMRRARRRRFKDEFLPRATYDKRRDGYYFGTGARGTGYYLDESAIDYGDVDDEGYVLVRVAPPVALQRALPRRRSVDKQGLLFDEAFLDTLGPAHGAPSDRYCVVAPPWLGGMPPPQERFEKEDTGGMKATFTDEMARERLAYLAAWKSNLRRVRPRHPTLVDLRTGIYGGGTTRRADGGSFIQNRRRSQSVQRTGPSCASTRRSIPGKSPCWNRARRVWLKRRRWMVSYCGAGWSSPCAAGCRGRW